MIGASGNTEVWMKSCIERVDLLASGEHAQLTFVTGKSQIHPIKCLKKPDGQQLDKILKISEGTLRKQLVNMMPILLYSEKETNDLLDRLQEKYKDIDVSKKAFNKPL